MKKTLLAMTSALLLTGMSFTASAQSSYDERDDGYYYSEADDRYYSGRDDLYRNDSRYRDDGRYIDSRADIDRDGVYDQDDRYDNRTGRTWDRDRDGRNDRYEVDGRRVGYRDRDHDGVPNRFDRYDDRRYMARHRYQAGRYLQPRGYRYVRYDVGSRLPSNYYGSNYYVDYRPYGLQAPPRGYRWNRVGSDAYLVSITNGLVRDVIYSLFY